MSATWNKTKPAAKGIYRVSESRSAPDEAAPPAYSFWSGTAWSFTAPTISGTSRYIGSRSKIQNRAWREIEAVPA